MKLNANGTEISIMGNILDENSYISLTDIAKQKDPDDPRIVISNWMSSYSTIDFIATWENLYNPSFNRLEFQTVRNEPGRLIMTPKPWIDRMGAIGITSQAGRYGGTHAHSDIAFEFASWISPEFKLYIIKDYQRLKIEESKRLALGWDTKRELSKINYRIHTDAIKEFLVSPELTKQENRPLRQQEPVSDISEEIQCDNQSQEHCTIFGNSVQSKRLYGCYFYT